MLIALPSQNVI